MSKNTKLINPSVLAFERKLDTSDGIFLAGNWSDVGNPNAFKEISNQEKTVRGVIGNRDKGSAKDPAKLDADKSKANIQRVDVASLPPAADTLLVRYSLRILGNVGRPSACNNLDYTNKLRDVVGSYVEKYQMAELARRYACNLVNGRMLWRNRQSAEEMTIAVRQVVKGQTVQTWKFDCLEFSLRDFDASKISNRNDLQSLAKVFETALKGDGYTLLEVDAYARMGRGQEVYPSQELIPKEKSQDEKSKTLYQVAKVSAMHSQKLGNALRTIDTWFSESSEIGPIAIEPYGSVTTLGRAFRQPKQGDFFSLIDEWMLKDKTPAENGQHYVMAVLIRGGVFGESETPKKED
jgi:CRISPR-associated protein Csy3